MNLNLQLREAAQQIPISLLLRALAKLTLFNALQVNFLSLLLQLFQHIVARGSLLLLLFILLDLLSLLLFFLSCLTICHLVERFFDLFDPREGEIVLDLVLQHRDVVLYVEQREVCA